MNYSTSFTQMLISLRQLGCQVSTTLIVYKDNCIKSEIDYLTMRGGMVSFLPAGKEHRVNDDGRWLRDGRQDGKPARVVRKIITQSLIEDMDLKDIDFEKFSNYVASYIGQHGDGDCRTCPSYKIYVCNGEFIPLYYSNESFSNYAEGNLSNSCMRYSDPGFFDIYAENPQVISMAVCLDAEHKVAGRALIWKTLTHGICMDTIYASEAIRPMFIEFARENGMRYKSQQSCHHSLFDMLDGERDNKCDNVVVQLREYDFSYYPYMDTLMYVCMDTAKISNSCSNLEEYRTLRNTNGDYDESSGSITCAWSGERIDEDDSYYLEYTRPQGSYIEGNVHYDYVVSTIDGYRLEDDCVRVNGEYYERDSDRIVWVGWNNQYYLADDIVWDFNGDAIPYEYAVELSNGDYILEEDSVELYDGTMVELSESVLLWNNTYALKSDSIECKDTGTWFLIGTNSDVETAEINNI